MKKGGYRSYTINIYANTYQKLLEKYFTKTDMRRHRKKSLP